KEVEDTVSRILIFVAERNLNLLDMRALEVLAVLGISQEIGCVVKGGGPQRESNPPGNWFAPPGSNQSSSGGNETAEASGAEGRKGDWVSMQAVPRVNAEQASKRLTQEPTRPGFGEGRS